MLSRLRTRWTETVEEEDNACQLDTKTGIHLFFGCDEGKTTLFSEHECSLVGPEGLECTRRVGSIVRVAVSALPKVFEPAPVVRLRVFHFGGINGRRICRMNGTEMNESDNKFESGALERAEAILPARCERARPTAYGCLRVLLFQAHRRTRLLIPKGAAQSKSGAAWTLLLSQAERGRSDGVRPASGDRGLRPSRPQPLISRGCQSLSVWVWPEPRSRRTPLSFLNAGDSRVRVPVHHLCPRSAEAGVPGQDRITDSFVLVSAGRHAGSDAEFSI